MSDREVLLSAKDLRVSYGTGKGRLKVVNGVSFDIAVGETFALIGESGSGKSTISKAIVGLTDYEATELRLGGRDLDPKRRLRDGRAVDVQIIFQDPHSSFNPRRRVLSSIIEPAVAQGMKPKEATEKAHHLIEQAGLTGGHASRYPHQLSGGQKQRASIARALTVSPRLLICDEPLSALDVSLQAEILNLLLEIKRRENLAMLFITHDISLLPHLADRVGVLYLGRILEEGDARSVVEAPQHPYTKLLLESLPGVDRNALEPQHGAAAHDVVELPDPSNPPRGCPFHPRCPHRIDVCVEETPRFEAVSNHVGLACHVVGRQQALPAGAGEGPDAVGEP